MVAATVEVVRAAAITVAVQMEDTQVATTVAAVGEVRVEAVVYVEVRTVVAMAVALRVG